jgi:hypothetical protein
MERPDPRKPAGDSIRDIINPALQDDRKEKIQLEIISNIFANTAQALPNILQNNLSQLFNKLSYAEPEDKNKFLIEALTSTGAKGYSPIIMLSIPVATDFTSFSAHEINRLPGYIKFHEAARAANVAVKVIGLLREEAGMQPRVVLDASKTYEQGAMENAQLYPQLPDPPKPKDRRFDL